jgi:ketosteroid isomerase-like protein
MTIVISTQLRRRATLEVEQQGLTGGREMTRELTRRELLRTGMAGTAIGAATLAAPKLALAQRLAGGISGPESQVGRIYQLQAAFHRAKTTQDLDLMMSLWADDATFNNKSTGTIYAGCDQIKSFWQSSGSFTHHRFSLVPSYKTTIEVRGHEAFLYFECHDIGDFASGNFNDLAVKTIVNDTYLAGTLRNIGDSWVFWNMTAGPSAPLSYDTNYFPIP